MNTNDDYKYNVIAPIVFVTALLSLLMFGIGTTNKPITSSKNVKKVLPTQEELKKIDQKQNFAFIDGVLYYYSK